MYILYQGLNSKLSYGASIGSILNLLYKSSLCVTDEPFVSPYVDFVERLERGSSIPILRVDSSTIVPPSIFLKNVGKVGKAWQWQEKTKHLRDQRVQAAINGEFDGVKIREFEGFDYDTIIPSSWKSEGVEIMTVNDLRSLNVPIKSYVTSKISSTSTGGSGTDIGGIGSGAGGGATCAGVCNQTNGSNISGSTRWNKFVKSSLKSYAKNRNDCTKPHSVSRISSYLNLGIVSIFKCVNDVKGNSKMEDEILKFREHSYAFCYSHPSHILDVLPNFAVKSFESRNGRDGCTDLKGLEEGNTDCKIWNGMQKYLVETGELHNNVRMTWGKTAVDWLTSSDLPLDECYRVLMMLNDKYALDGFSPPSVLGVLWCFGLGDKPGGDGGWRNKPSRNYKVDVEGFELAQRRLLNMGDEGKRKSPGKSQRVVADFFQPLAKKHKTTK